MKNEDGEVLPFHPEVIDWAKFAKGCNRVLNCDNQSNMRLYAADDVMDFQDYLACVEGKTSAMPFIDHIAEAPSHKYKSSVLKVRDDWSKLHVRKESEYSCAPLHFFLIGKSETFGNLQDFTMNANAHLKISPMSGDKLGQLSQEFESLLKETFGFEYHAGCRLATLNI